jgi:hypothetical protein
MELSNRGSTKSWLCVLLFCAHAGWAAAALAQDAPRPNYFVPDQGKLPLTAGFNDIEGAGGGGVVPWALITGYGTRDSFGANAHVSLVNVGDFRLLAYGVAVGIMDRVEFSATHQNFDVTGTPLDGLRVAQNILGVKIRLTGDAVYDQDSWLPQTAVGYEYKHNQGISDGAKIGAPGLFSVNQLGARGESGSDFYLSATKVLLAQSVLLNASLRYTKANQFGLLGFGGDRRNSRSVNAEVTLAYILTRKLAVGGEYRQKPHNLGVDDERGAWDVFAAWTPTRHVSVVAGFVSLGSILAPVSQVSRSQNGAYLSIQAGY